MTTQKDAVAAERATLIAQAVTENAEYPQYAGHFYGYDSGVLTRDIATKRGLVGRKGQRVIATVRKPNTPPDRFAKEVVAYLDGCDTLISPTDIVFDGDEAAERVWTTTVNTASVSLKKEDGIVIQTPGGALEIGSTAEFHDLLAAM